MTVHISTLTANVPIEPPKKRRARFDDCSITLEMFNDSCRVWDTVNGTVCGDFFYYRHEDANPILCTKQITEMPFFHEVFRYLTDEYALHRKDPIGEFLRPAITGMETALAAKEGSCVYFAEAEGRIKVGWSKQVASRVAQLQTGNAAPIKLLGVVPGGRAKEREIHDLFASVRLAGEWFTATPELLAYIRSEARSQ